MNNAIDRKRIFEEVRDVPYRISLRYDEPDQSCEGKYKMFMKLAEKYNIKARPLVFEYQWDSLDLPEQLLRFHLEKDILHICPEVYIEEKGIWVPADPSWDIGLKNKHKCIHVNEWDEQSPTELSVPPTKLYTPEESLVSSSEKMLPEEFEEDIKENGGFYKAFNDWLEELRRK